MTGALQMPGLRAEVGFNRDIPLVIPKRIKTCEGAQKAGVLRTAAHTQREEEKIQLDTS